MSLVEIKSYSFSLQDRLLALALKEQRNFFSEAVNHMRNGEEKKAKVALKKSALAYARTMSLQTYEGGRLLEAMKMWNMGLI